MKISELLKYVDEEQLIVFAHIDAQNIGFKYKADNVPIEMQNMEVCEISAEDNNLSVIFARGC